MKSVIFVKLKSSTSQRSVYISYKIDYVADGNLISLQNFKTFFQKSKIEALHVTKPNY